MTAAGWLSSRRINWIAGILFAVEVLVFGLLALATHGYFGPMNPPGSSDFLSFYAAGKLADQGQANAVYDQTRHWAMERVIFGDPRVPYYYYFYPPVFTLLCAGLARLPYLTAFVFFVGTSLVLYLACLHRISGNWRIPLLCLSFPAVPFVIGLGQNSFLTAAILGSGLILIDRKPFRAGIVFGLLCYKPHLAIMVPVALAAGRQARALAGMAVSASLLLILSLLVLGTQPWQAEFAHLGAMQRVFETGAIPFTGLVSLFGAIRLLGGGMALAYTIHAVGAAIAAAAMILVWSRPGPPGPRAASLIAAGLAATPVILFYDLLPVTIALAFLTRDPGYSGYQPWERWAWAILWAIPGLVIVSGEFLHLPIGPLAVFLLLGLALLPARPRQIDIDAGDPPVLNAGLP